MGLQTSEILVWTRTIIESMIDHTLSTKVSKAGKLAVLIVCIDDIVLFGYDITKIIQLKKKMGDEFEINDLGNLKYFLRMG